MKAAIFVIGVAVVLGIANVAWADEATFSNADSSDLVTDISVLDHAASWETFLDLAAPPVVTVKSGDTVTVSCDRESPCPNQYKIDATSSKAYGLGVIIKGVTGKTYVLFKRDSPFTFTESSFWGFEIYSDAAVGWTDKSDPPFRPGIHYVALVNGATQRQTYTLTFVVLEKFEFEFVRLTSGVSQTVTCEGTSKPHETFNFCPKQFYIDVPSGTTTLDIEVRGSGDLFVIRRVGSKIEPDEESYRGWRCPDGILQRTEQDPESGTHYFALGNMESSSQQITIKVTVSKNTKPVARFTAPSSAKVGESVTFDAKDSYDPDPGDRITKYVWEFGDGRTKSTTDSTITYAYDRAGTYTVKLVVYDTKDAASDPYTKSITIVAPEKPTACFSASPTRGTAPLTVRFSNCSTNADSFFWEFGDGGTSTPRAPTYTYRSPGKYTVKLTARGPGGEATETKRDYIEVIAPLPASPSNLTADPMSSTEIKLEWRDNSDNEEGFKIERRLGKTGSWSEIKRVGANTTRYTDTGLQPNTEYCYRVRAYNAQGDSDYSNEACATTPKPPVPAPIADFSAEPTSGPAPLTVRFTDKSTGEITSWSWEFGDGGRSTERNPTYTYQRPGKYTVKLTVKGPGGENTKTRIDYISVTLPTYDFQATAKQGQLTYIPIPDSIKSLLPAMSKFIEKPRTTLAGRTSDSLADVGFQLNRDTGTIFGSPSKAGSFNFLIAAQAPSTGQEVAYIWALVTVTVPPPPTNQPPVADPGGPYAGQVGEQLTFDGSRSYDPDGQITSYAWDFGDNTTGTGVKVTHAYTVEGTYNVCLTVTDNGGLTDKKCTTAQISAAPPPPGKQPPVAKFTFDPADPQPGAMVTFNGRESFDPDGGSIMLYEWDFSDGSPKNYGMIVTHAFTAAGIYKVTLTVTDDEQQTGSTTQQVCVGMPCPAGPTTVQLTSGEPKPGSVEAKGLAQTQYTIQIERGTKLLMVRLKGHGNGDLNLYVRYGEAIEVVDGSLQADFAAATPWPLESVTITDPRPGTYYIGVENTSDTPQDFTILAATVPVLQLLTSGVAVEGDIAAAEVGRSRLGLVQYVLEVPEGSNGLQVTLENLGIGRLNLHIRYDEPIEALDGRVVANYSSTSGLGLEQIVLMGPQLKAGRYYIAVENLEPYPQQFRLTATIGQGPRTE